MPPRKKESRKHRVPDSFESCMDAGVEQDERAERFAVGEKAERHYVEAAKYYERAAQYTPTSVDAWYNAARVHYVLGTQFAFPPRAQETLLEACRLYAEALDRAPVPADGVPTASRLDVLSNGGYALQALAELVDEWGTMGLDTACLQAAACAGVKTETHMPTSLYLAAALWFEQAAQGQTLVLQQALAAVTASEGAAFPSASSDTPDDGEFTTSLVAPSSLLESFHDQINVFLALLPRTENAGMLDEIVSTVRGLFTRAEEYIQSLPPNYGAQQSPADEWNEQVQALDMAALSMQVMAIEHAVGLNTWPSPADLDAMATSIEERAASILALPPPAQSLTAVRLGADAEARIQKYELAVSRLCDLSDQAHVIARLRIWLLAQGDTASAARAWHLGTIAAKYLRVAVAPLETPGPSSIGRVLPKAMWVHRDASTAPLSNASTAITRHRASMYTELSRVSLTRCHTLLAAHCEAAANAQMQLVDHARIYARKALVDGGMPWICQIQQLPSEPGYICGGAVAHALPHGGSESLAQDASSLWQYVRALWMRSNVLRTPETELELRIALAAVWSLAHASDEYRMVLADPRHVQDMLDNTTVALSDAERTFWDDVWLRIISSAVYDPANAC